MSTDTATEESEVCPLPIETDTVDQDATEKSVVKPETQVQASHAQSNTTNHVIAESVRKPDPQVDRYPHIPRLETPYEIAHGIRKDPYPRSSSLTSQLQPVELFQCPHCEWCSKRKDRLTEHIRNHFKEKQHRCAYCGYASHYKAALKTHMQRHTKVKPWKCHICDKGLSTKQSLNQHLLIHSGLKPHGCGACSKKFRTKAQLNIHFRKHHL